MGTAILASLTEWLAPLKSLKATWNILVAGTPAFLVAAIAMVLVASALVRCDEWAVSTGPSRTRQRIAAAIKVIHAIPLLMAPAVVAGSLILFAQDRMGVPLSAIQNFRALAVMGFIQHVFIAYLILEHVLKLSTRWAAAARYVVNMPVNWSARRFAVRFQAAAPPAVITVGVLLLMQHAMLAAPSFLTKKNAIVDLRQFLEREGPSLHVRLAAAAIIAVTVATLLVTLYGASRTASLALLRLAALRTPPSPIDVARRRQRGSDTPYLALAVAALSAVVQATVATIVFYFVVSSAVEATRTITADAASILVRTMYTPGVVCAVGACLSLIVWAAWFRSRSLKIDSGRVLIVAAVLAFTPPSVYASLVLPLLSASTQQILLWTLLLVWSGGIAIFMMYEPIAVTRYPELLNLRFLEASPNRRVAGALVGKLGTLLPGVVAVTYIVWIEDGIHSTIDPSYDTLSNILYRSVDGRWSVSALVAILFAFGFWALTLAIVRKATARRSPLLARAVSRALLIAAATIGLLASVAIAARPAIQPDFWRGVADHSEERA